MEFLESFENFQAELKEKWLDYYETNVDWIHTLMDSTNRWYKLSEGSRPDSMLVLGAVSALDSNCKGLMNSFLKLSIDQNKLVLASGLNFDPDLELEKREEAGIREAKIIPLLAEMESQKSSNTDTGYLDQIRQDMNQ
jgi:Family of unknown function (DUF5331)